MARVQADWEQIDKDTKESAAQLAEQREKEAIERAIARKAKAEMSSLCVTIDVSRSSFS